MAFAACTTPIKNMIITIFTLNGKFSRFKLADACFSTPCVFSAISFHIVHCYGNVDELAIVLYCIIAICYVSDIKLYVSADNDLCVRSVFNLFGADR